MAVITYFNFGRRRVVGVLPMPDGARRTFQGTSVAQVLRLWAEAIPGMSLCRDCRLWSNQRRSGAATAPRSPYKDGRRRQ